MREGFYIGPLFIHYYGILIMLGVLAAAWLTDRQAKKRGENTDFVWDALPWALIGGIIGARLWHILFPPESMVATGITTYFYLTHPLDALAIWKGGLGIVGAVLGGALALFLYTRRKKVSFLVWTDMVAPGLALAQAIGRWGNFVNQELYGLPSNLPWAIYIDETHRKKGFQDQAYYHPLFLYESIWNLINMGLLLWVGKKYAGKLKNGDIFLVYLIVYPIGRFLLEFLRVDTAYVMDINANQWLMPLTTIAAGGILFFRHRKKMGRPGEEIERPDVSPMDSDSQKSDNDPEGGSTH